MARDTRNFIFLDYKFYMFGGKLYNNPPDLKMGVQETAFIMMIERSLFVTSGMKTTCKINIFFLLNSCFE